MAIEEPAYEVLLETKHYELRRYEPYIVAEVDVDESFERAGNSAFGVLAGYIFGDNEPQQKMAMTAPVESREGERMSMTTPVTSRVGEGDGSFTYAFVMERKYTMDTLPRPNNPDIRLVERPQRVMAVHRYSGTWSKERYAEHEKILLDALAACFPGGSITGAPKRRAMEILTELEPCARGLFTGCLFWFGDDGSTDASILIRSTILSSGRLWVGAGGGIVADSQPQSRCFL